MKKRLLSLLLCAIMVLPIALTGCANSSTASGDETTSSTSSSSSKAMTLTLYTITDSSTTDEALAQVEEAINVITESDFNTHIILRTATEKQYEKMISDAVEDIEEQIRIAEEEAAALLAEEEAAALKDEERAARLEKRLAEQAGEAVEEPAEEEPAAEETPAEGEETAENVNEFGEEEIVEEEEEYVVPDKYKTVGGSVVRVEYEGNVNFILNYNSYAITVEYEGQEYEIAGLDFVRID